MNANHRMLTLSLCACFMAFRAATAAQVDASPPAAATAGATVDVASVRAELGRWLDARQADESARRKIDDLWSALPAKPNELDVLDALSRSFAVVDPSAAQLAELCAKPRTGHIVPAQPWLLDASTPTFMANNMRLAFGRWLVHAEMFDEAIEQLSGLAATDVVAPTTLLFYQALAQHTLLRKDDGLKTLGELEKAGPNAPRRYAVVAKLLEEDLKSLQDESLDHIARRMNDVRRKLGLGRGGKKVREQEDGIIESLDKIIKKLEEQQSSSSSAGGMQDNIRSSSPAPDSMPIGGKGPGDVTKRDIGSQADWGSISPAEREKALQEISRDFPPHFRDVIEQYFRRLAAEENP